MAEPIIKSEPVRLTKSQIDDFYEAFNDAPEGPDAFLAKTLVDEFATAEPNILSGGYSALKNPDTFMEHPLYKALAGQGLKYEKPMSDVELINIFARDEEGLPFEEGTFFGGMKREVGPSASSLAGFYVGAKLGAKAVSGVPPVTPPTIALKFGTPLVTGVIGALTSYEAGEAATDLFLGKEKAVTPGTRAAYEAGKTAGGAMGWLPLPYVIPKTVSFGATQYLDNVMNLAKQPGPLTAEALATPGVKQAIGGLGPAKYGVRMQDGVFVPYLKAPAGAQKGTTPGSTRFISAIERLLGRTGETARKYPIPTGATELLAGAGSAAGAYTAETAYPGQGGTRLAMEVGFGFAPGIVGSTLIEKAPVIKSVLGEALSKFKSGGLKEGLSVLKTSRQAAGVQRIMDILESQGEDVDTIIERLASEDLTKELFDEAGQPIKLTAGMKSESPALMAIEMALSTSSPGLGRERKLQNKRAADALRNVISSIIMTSRGPEGSGNPEAIKLAAGLAQDAFVAGQTARLQQATDNVLSAFSRVQGEAPEKNALLSQRLYDTVQNQLELARRQERKLWKDIPDREITEFVDAEGNDLDAPNFITTWQSIMPKTPEAAAIINNDLRPLASFVDRKLTELGMTATAAPSTATTSPARRKVDTAFSKITGTAFEDKFSNLMSQMSDLPADQQIKRLREEASRNRGKFSSKRSKDYANLLDAQAEIIPVGPKAAPEAVSRVDELIPNINQSALDSFNQRLARDAKTRSTEGRQVLPEQDMMDPDALRKMADTNDQVAVQNEAIYRQDPASGQQFADMAEQVRQEAALLRARADDLENPIQKPAAATAETPATGGIMMSEIQDMRSVALNLGRQMQAQGNTNAARIAFSFADSLLNDLESIRQGDDVAYDIARAYSRSLNDTFTRAFAGDILSTTKTGAERLAPELLAQRLFQGGSEPTALRIQQLQGVIDFAQTQGLEGAEQTAKTINGTIESLLRNARAASFKEVRNPETGEITREIDFRALNKWIQDNEALLGPEGFPALKADLENASTAQVLLSDTRLDNKRRAAQLKDEVNFQNLLPNNVDNPTLVVRQAINGKVPLKSLNNILKLTETAPEGMRQSARDGFKATLLESAMTAAGGTGRSFSPRAMYDELFSQMKNVNTRMSLADYMLGKDLATETEINQIKKVLTEMVRIEVADVDGSLAEIAKDAGPMLDFYLRITGSALGGKIAGVTGDTQSLIARSAGSRMMRQIFEDVPESMKMDVMSELMKNPELLAKMMRKPRSERERLQIGKVIGDTLIDLGFRPVRRAVPFMLRETGDEILETELPPEQPQQTSQLIPAQPAAPPPTTALASVSPPPAPRPAPPAPQTGPVNRASYAAMFPNDIASSMIRQQGIGSLMG